MSVPLLTGQSTLAMEGLRLPLPGLAARRSSDLRPTYITSAGTTVKADTLTRSTRTVHGTSVEHVRSAVLEDRGLPTYN